MSWFFLALCMAIGTAGVRLTNQHFRMRGIHLVVFMRIIMLALLVPFIGFISWPGDPLFYLATAATIPLVLFLDQRVFNLCAQIGSGPVSRIEPIENIFVFVVWTFLNISLLASSIDEPVRLISIFLAISGSVFCAFLMSKSHISARILKLMLPVILTEAIIIMLNKTAMDHARADMDVLIYIFIQSAGLVVFGGGYLLISKKMPEQVIGDKRFLVAIGIICLFTFMHMICKGVAFRLVENPAYVTVINLTAPVWILIYNRLTGHPDNIKVLPGLGIVLCAAVLVLATHL